VSALLGPNADEEMRLTRLTAAELRSDSALLLDAVKAVGFFPGPRAVQVDQATDGLSRRVRGRACPNGNRATRRSS
jgi:DNA polymerase-3 subunit delta